MIFLLLLLLLLLSIVLSTGSGKLLLGLDIAIGTMRVKEKSRFLLRSDYAYGGHGCPPRIPGHATCECYVCVAVITSAN